MNSSGREDVRPVEDLRQDIQENTEKVAKNLN